MAKSFDPQKWDKLIQKPDWYMSRQWQEYDDAIKQAEKSDHQKANELKAAIRYYFADRLSKGQVALANDGDNLDERRKSIDAAVIHHTSERPGRYNLPYLNAVHLLQIYLPYYRKPTLKIEKHLKGQPLWSGHFYRGQQVFWGYHWFIDSKGKAIRLLDDSKIGWHSGNWDINCRSVGICLDGDFTDTAPPDALIKTAKKIVNHYKNVRVIGHRDAREGTECPGNTFASWKGKIIS